MRWAVMAGLFAVAIAAVVIYGRSTGLRAGDDAILAEDDRSVGKPGAPVDGGFVVGGELARFGTLVRVIDDRADQFGRRKVKVMEGEAVGQEDSIPLVNLRHARR